jgi:hypothetical protein
VGFAEKENPGRKNGDMSQSHITLDFPIKSPASAKALTEELPPLMPDCSPQKCADDGATE